MDEEKKDDVSVQTGPEKQEAQAAPIVETTCEEVSEALEETSLILQWPDKDNVPTDFRVLIVDLTEAEEKDILRAAKKAAKNAGKSFKRNRDILEDFMNTDPHTYRKLHILKMVKHWEGLTNGMLLYGGVLDPKKGKEWQFQGDSTKIYKIPFSEEFKRTLAEYHSDDFGGFIVDGRTLIIDEYIKEKGQQLKN